MVGQNQGPVFRLVYPSISFENGTIHRVRDTVARFKVRYTRGTLWIQFVTNLLIILTAIQAFESSFSKWFAIPQDRMWAVFILITAAYFIACYMIGHIDEFYGIWKQENSYSLNVSPTNQDILARLDRIEQHLEKDVSDGK